MSVRRHDYAFPFRIDAASGQAARANYADHVRQMVRQVLFTARGERADLPEFGCGVRQLLFAPNSDALRATTELQVRQGLDRWLGGQIQVKKVQVTAPEGLPGEGILVTIEYVLVEEQTTERTEVRIL